MSPPSYGNTVSYSEKFGRMRNGWKHEIATGEDFHSYFRDLQKFENLMAARGIFSLSPFLVLLYWVTACVMYRLSLWLKIVTDCGYVWSSRYK